MAQTKKSPGTNKSTASRSGQAARTNTPRTGTARNAATQRTRSVPKPKKELTQEQIENRTQKFAVVLFAIAILSAALILIEGESVWTSLHNFILGLLGACAIILPILIFYIAIVSAMKKLGGRLHIKVLITVLIVILISTAIYAFRARSLPENLTYFETLHDLYLRGVDHESLGLVGGVLGYPMIKLFGVIGSRIIVILLLFVALMLLTGTTLISLFKAVKKPVDIATEHIEQSRETRRRNRDLLASDIDIPLGGERPVQRQENPGTLPVADAFEVRSGNSDKLERLYRAQNDLSGKSPAAYPAVEASAMPPKLVSDVTIEDVERSMREANFRNQPGPGETRPAEREPIRVVRRRRSSDKEPVPQETQTQPSVKEEAKPQEEKAEIPEIKTDTPPIPEYELPPTSLLVYSASLDPRKDSNETEMTAKNLVETLRSFGVQTSIIGVSKGPTVTRYELQPAAGVKISRITNLTNDLALNLAASGIRIEAPIPGKAAVGIEVPNKTKAMVRMREMIESEEFQKAKSKLTVTLGRDIAGKYVFADLAKMPHLLIAGTTGSGKSVCVNSFILSILYKAKPNEVKLIMIDPKMVELPIYNGIPHLLIPVVTDPKKAAGALNWAVGEMMKRYNIFAETGVRDIDGYNRLIEMNKEVDLEGNPREKMPQIVIVIDELADLMMVAPNEVEDAICRIAQLARAAGIHLVVATQRPSVDVITGLIKANVPSRIALTVASLVDSRTILDTGGAEKLLGNGDMLFAPVGSVKPARVQGCYVSDEERESVINFVKQGFENRAYDENIAKEIENIVISGGKGSKAGASSEDSDLSEEDPMLEEAIELAVDSGQISTSALQRRFRLGYARAGRIVDMMEQKGIVGPSEGSKPRKVLITKAQWLERNMMKSDEPEE